MKSLLIISLIITTACTNTDRMEQRETNIQAVIDACTLGEVRESRYISRDERVELICK